MTKPTKPLKLSGKMVTIDIKPKKTYLCIEDGERFTIEATDMDEARRLASMWNAQVIEELK